MSTELNKIKDQLQEVRRDQLNYQIERDLLKEMYSSYIQTINIVIGVIVAFFTILGYLGLKNIREMARDFRGELSELTKLKVDYQNKFAELDNLDKKYRARFRQLRKTNIEQDKRLELLEIQEKASSLIKNREYTLALDEVSKGLKKHPEDQSLALIESYLFMKLKKYDEAISCAKKLLERNPDNIGLIANITEAYLLLDRQSDYESNVSQYRTALFERYSYFILWYFEAIKLYLQDDIAKLKEHILSRLDKDSVKLNINKIDGWEYDDIRSVIYHKPDTRIRSLLLKFIDYLEGNISGQELTKYIDGIA